MRTILDRIREQPVLPLRRPSPVPLHSNAPFAGAGTALALAFSVPAAQADDALPASPIESVSVIGNWLGSGLQNSVQGFPGARTVLGRTDIEATGAASIGDVMRRIPGVQSTDNSGTAGSAISLNIGVRGLTGR